ncbi:MAG: hypothetical protein IKD81_08695 [Eubacteriaceae bacterium]|nr:hypothetical protein [Eubacteriaceae bacterium]
MQKKLRFISVIMFIAAAVFVMAALSNPGLGNVVYIGGCRFGAKQWRVCYTLYAALTVSLFSASFFVKGRD